MHTYTPVHVTFTGVHHQFVRVSLVPRSRVSGTYHARARENPLDRERDEDGASIVHGVRTRTDRSRDRARTRNDLYC